MPKALVVVESPAKARAVKHHLGKGFEVLACYGHVLDFKPKEDAVNVDRDFAINYQPIKKNEKHVTEIAETLQQANTLYLATSPDCEGETIAWQLREALSARIDLKDKTVKRLIFNEISKAALQKAINNPRDLCETMVNAHRTRRVLDYLLSFNLSPLLWKKIRRGLTADRIQNAVLRLIVEREQARENFQALPYWTIDADITPMGTKSSAKSSTKSSAKKQTFSARLTHYQTTTLEQFSVNSPDIADAIETTLNILTKGNLTVTNVENTQQKQKPSPPFITSTLLQEAAIKLGFSAQRTMRTAQQLFEGVNIGDDPDEDDGENEYDETGLISFPQTDSNRIPEDAANEIRDFISRKYSNESIPDSPHVYLSLTQNTDHEAIRPTSIKREPKQIKAKLSANQYKLYDLIWKRSIACQMIHASIDTINVDFDAIQGIFRATSTRVSNPGFMAVYAAEKDTKAENPEDEGRILPPLKKGDKVKLQEIRREQHYAEAPSRFTEASLINALEELGLGRPSTYAAMITSLQNKEYIEQEKKQFYPTDVGRVVNKFLTQHFARYVDYQLNAQLESDIDAIARGEKEWLPLVREFWQPFAELVKNKHDSVNKKDVTQEALDEKCPQCSEALSIRLGRRGNFIGCTAYPQCDYTRNLDESQNSSNETGVFEGRSCPDCESPLAIKQGRYGKFIGCTTYPACKYIEPLDKPDDTGVNCPECQKKRKNSAILKRHSRTGKTFYSCAAYPTCSYSLWNPPIAEKCPDCGWPILSLKTTKRKGAEKVCPQKTCQYTAPYETT